MPKLKVRLQAAAPIPLEAEFDCAPGELVALLGPSGSGKTSLLRAVAGLVPASGLRGQVHVGQEVWFDSVRRINLPPQARCAGLLFQSYALFPHLSAIENVAVCADSTVAAGQKHSYIEALFGRLGLNGLEHRLPAQLSGGQQQRVALARALVRVQTAGRHGVLLLDEPFSAVDAPARDALYRELAALRQHVSTPIVLVTHDLLEARRLADRVVILDGGTTLQSGAPDYVFRHPRNARVARLVGIQNLFHGRLRKLHPGLARLDWGDAAGQGNDGPHLFALDKDRIPDGADVSWVLSGESMQVLPWPTPQVPEGVQVDNLLECVLGEVLSLGETSLCMLVPVDVPRARLTLTLSTAQLRTLAAGPGVHLGLRIAPQAIHIMPLRQQ